MRRIALFARVPGIGPVKTRLTPALPREAALALYRGMLADARDVLLAATADERYVYWAAGREPSLAGGLAERTQSEGDLGARLAAAFAELLPRAGDRAAICGADAPALTAGAIERALEALEGAELALALARDGGFSLIAMARPAPELFRDVEWSAAGTARQILDRARALGLRVATLENLDDVDTAEDLGRLVAWAVTAAGARAPHTRAALRALGFLPAA